MIQIYWAGWDKIRWRFFKGGWAEQGITLIWTIYVGPVEVSYYHVYRFGED